MTTDADLLHHEFLDLWLCIFDDDNAEALKIIENGGADFCLYVIRHLTDCFVAESDRDRDWWRMSTIVEMGWEDLL